MKAKLLPFPHPRPPSGRTLRVDLTDDALIHLGFFAGACFIILRGAVWDQLPHALEFDGEVYLGVLRFVDLKTVEFFSWHEGKHSGTYPLKALTVLGAISQVLPFGDAGAGWSFNANPKQNETNHELGSLLKASVK